MNQMIVINSIHVKTSPWLQKKPSVTQSRIYIDSLLQRGFLHRMLNAVTDFMVYLTMLSDTFITMKAGSCKEKACIQTVSQTSYLCVCLIHRINMSLCRPIKSKYDKFFAPRREAPEKRIQREALGHGLVGPPLKPPLPISPLSPISPSSPSSQISPSSPISP